MSKRPLVIDVTDQNEQLIGAISKVKDDLSLMSARLDECTRYISIQDYLVKRRAAMDVIDNIIHDYKLLIEVMPA